MEGSIEARVSHEVELWLRWLPTWHPGTHRARTRLCRRCFGSPVIAAAGLVEDVPHAVQHSLSMRMKVIVDAAVDTYTERNLPLLRRELRLIDERRSNHGYRPNEGLDPAYNGLDLDPEPIAGQPTLFTFAELSQAEPVAAAPPRSAPLSAEEKQSLKQEIALADECAKQAGKRVCLELAEHRDRMRQAIDTLVEPQVQALLADLESELDSPSWPLG